MSRAERDRRLSGSGRSDRPSPAQLKETHRLRRTQLKRLSRAARQPARRWIVQDPAPHPGNRVLNLTGAGGGGPHRPLLAEQVALCGCGASTPHGSKAARSASAARAPEGVVWREATKHAVHNRRYFVTTERSSEGFDIIATNSLKEMRESPSISASPIISRTCFKQPNKQPKAFFTVQQQLRVDIGFAASRASSGARSSALMVHVARCMAC